jgi:hypothetical protein
MANSFVGKNCSNNLACNRLNDDYSSSIKSAKIVLVILMHARSTTDSSLVDPENPPLPQQTTQRTVWLYNQIEVGFPLQHYVYKHVGELARDVTSVYIVMDPAVASQAWGGHDQTTVGLPEGTGQLHPTAGSGTTFVDSINHNIHPFLLDRLLRGLAQRSLGG